MAVIDELLVGLGFEYDPKQLQQFKNDLGKTTNAVKQLTKAAVAGATALIGMTTASTRASDEQGKLAAEIGDSVDNIDALQFALQRSGGTAEGMASSLQQLAIRAGEAARGVGSGLEAFGLLGISVTNTNGQLKSTSNLLLEVSQRFQGLSKAQQIDLADKLGLRDSIRLLQQGPSAIRELTAEARALGVTTAEDAAISADFQDSLTDLWRIVKQVSRTLSRVFAPVLNEIVDSFTEWWKLNRQLIEQNIPAWVETATRAIKLLALAFAGVIAVRLVSHLLMLINLMKGLTLATLAFNAAALLIPALITAAVVAVGLLIDEIKTFVEGGESILGDLVERFPKLKEAIEAMVPVLKTVSDVLIANFKTVEMVLGSIVNLIQTVIDGWTNLISIFSTKSLDDFREFFKTLPSFFGDVTGLAPAGGGGVIQDVGQSIAAAGALVRNTVVDKVDIVIQGGADTAENIANAVFNVFQQTAEDLNSPVDQ